MLILFQPACFSSSGSDHFNIRKPKYQFFSTVFVSSVSKLPLFFPPSLPFVFLQGLRFLLQVSILLMGSFSILFRQCSYPVILMKILMELQVRHSSFFSSPVDSSQVLLIIPFSSFQCLLIPVHLIVIHFSLFNCFGVLKISRRFVFPLCIRSSSFEIGISFKSFNSTGATSLLNLFNGVLLSGP